MQIEAKDGPLTGAPPLGANYTYAGNPVSNVVAYSMSNGGNFASPFADNPAFVPFNTKLLRFALLRAAYAAFRNPNKQVWATELHDGAITLYVGDYGNVKASISLGAIAGTPASKRDQHYANGTMADYNGVARSRGEPEPFPPAKYPPKRKTFLEKLLNL